MAAPLQCAAAGDAPGGGRCQRGIADGRQRVGVEGDARPQPSALDGAINGGLPVELGQIGALLLGSIGVDAGSAHHAVRPGLLQHAEQRRRGKPLILGRDGLLSGGGGHSREHFHLHHTLIGMRTPKASLPQSRRIGALPSTTSRANPFGIARQMSRR
jgi:hypothetical protein